MLVRLNGRPGDERGFIHKKILGGISKIAGIVPLPGAKIVSRITGALAGRKQQKQAGARAKFAPEPAGSTAACEVGFRRHSTGVCVPRVSGSLIGTGLAPSVGTVARSVGTVARAPGPVGDAVMGRYGAALEPGSMIIDRSVCLRGMQLADDGLCYNKSQISNKQRMWPAGRKPLLTSGDMRAISTAARAGRRLEGATKRLQRMGMMKKPASRGRAALPRHRHALPTAAVSVE